MNTPQEPEHLLPADVTGDFRLAFGKRLPRVGGALAIMLEDGFVRGPETSDRSRRSMRAKLAQLSTASLVLAIATSGLAVAGALPAPVQEAVSGAAESIGVTLPEGGWEPIAAPPAAPETAASGSDDDRDDDGDDERDDANRSNRTAAPEGERTTRATDATELIDSTSTTLALEPIVPTTAPPVRGRPGEGRVAGPPTPPSTDPEPEATTTTAPETTTSTTTAPETTTTEPEPEPTTTIPETTTTVGEPPPSSDG